MGRLRRERGFHASPGILMNGSWKLLRLFFSTWGKTVRREDNDKVIWKQAQKGLFSVKSIYAALEEERAVSFPMTIIWNPWVPSKVSFLCMKLVREEF